GQRHGVEAQVVPRQRRRGAEGGRAALAGRRAAGRAPRRHGARGRDGEEAGEGEHVEAARGAALTFTPLREPFDGDAALFRLGVEAQRLALAYEYDPYFSPSIARINPQPHQLEAVYDHFLKLPRIRFLLADDPGAGKTIMAGLLLKEL